MPPQGNPLPIPQNIMVSTIERSLRRFWAIRSCRNVFSCLAQLEAFGYIVLYETVEHSLLLIYETAFQRNADSIFLLPS